MNPIIRNGWYIVTIKLNLNPSVMNVNEVKLLYDISYKGGALEFY